MAGKVGEAFVEVVADYRLFVTKAQKELNVLLERLAAKADFTPMTEASGDAGEEGGREYGDRFEREVNSSSSKTRRRRTGERIGREFSKSVSSGVDNERDRRGLLARIFGGDEGRDRSFLGRTFGQVGDVLGGLFGTLGSAGSALGSVVGTIASLSSGFLTLLAVAGVLAPVIFTLTGALVSLSGVVLLLPAGLGVLVGVLGVAMIAFQGFGEALSAIASGDAEKIDKALGALSPKARSVAKEFQAMWPALQAVKTLVQDAFFGPLMGHLTRLADAVLPKITPGLNRIASLLGTVAALFIDRLASPQGIAFFTEMLDTIGDIILAVGPQMERLFGAIMDAVVASLPFAEQLFKAIGDGLERFAEFIDTKVADGSFQEFLENALLTAGDFVTVLQDLLDLFAALFEDTDEGGQRFLQDISEALRKLTDFFKSPEGKEALNAMIKLAGLFGQAMILAAGQVGAVYGGLKTVKRWAEDAINAVQRLLEKLANPVLRTAHRIFDIPFFADGGLVTTPTLGMIGEAGPEVVVPLNDPQRAQELMTQTGLVNLAAGMGGGDMQVVVYLGTEQITDILDKRITRGFKQQGRRLAQGTREG